MGKWEKDKDYKCKTSFTKKEYIPDPTPQTQTIIESFFMLNLVIHSSTFRINYANNEIWG